MNNPNLTPRSQRLLDYLYEFPLATHEDIASAFELKRGTIEKHMQELYKELNIDTVKGLDGRIRLYDALGWIKPACDWCGDWRDYDGASPKPIPVGDYRSIREAARAEGMSHEGLRLKLLREERESE